ncbi:phenylacetate-CoA oxygenase subunit PaaC [Lysinibacillus sp. CNPSo 3705]|uniref:1,2-phenylacetyl-CoA epoxidase subunit PaaC n=1 Tax=Lysinibacillus sp. CNPSo 3705 TaxID=3028148 RepID=UPI002363BF63|nr:1,2-phenylacetyl-CoA epoxidase subunit PaaC [Lysinibacillus sp. CNPSo 3705]MDD1502444.1 phenylacetate-CoA oxygenase subunit PaaC [Lysinibacillus sp. CNPSo 3705]
MTQEVKPEYKKAVLAVLYQLADDDYLFSYRGSEWLGLAPHIEEDVAFSSITQDTMGHAKLYYTLLEELGEGAADSLAQLRSKEERFNSLLVERPNGEGYYKDAPNYDWGYAVARNFVYTTVKKAKIDALKASSYTPLKEVAVKISTELYYHQMHWTTWFTQLCTATEESRSRMMKALQEVIKDSGDLLSLGSTAAHITAYELIESEAVIKERWLAIVTPTFEAVEIAIPVLPEPIINGRNGQHTDDLTSAIETMSEVYRSDLAASW